MIGIYRVIIGRNKAEFITSADCLFHFINDLNEYIVADSCIGSEIIQKDLEHIAFGLGSRDRHIKTVKNGTGCSVIAIDELTIDGYCLDIKYARVILRDQQKCRNTIILCNLKVCNYRNVCLTFSQNQYAVREVFGIRRIKIVVSERTDKMQFLLIFYIVYSCEGDTCIYLFTKFTLIRQECAHIECVELFCRIIVAVDITFPILERVIIILARIIRNSRCRYHIDKLTVLFTDHSAVKILEGYFKIILPPHLFNREVCTVVRRKII